ncbi:phasin family protein [Azohydromonas caseinilytica]|uniref:Phasin family protein n=1 Tax=Azohydromonas caseinilytica TaxID=2728836 RepID=A0A848F3E0_9BURK|nr:phasin family protein [Azohydromonas caseinilytica]NML14587.1 phasin family protein [Azohydromonas caseinilytica]
MSTSPQRATSSNRSPRSPLAAAADAALESARTPAAHTALGAPAIELTASANEPLAEGNATLDSVINSWGERTTREQLRWQLSALNAALRGTQELGQAQAELSQQLLQSLERLGQQLQDARNLSDLATVQTSLAQADFDGLLRLSRRLTELGTNQALQLCQEASNGLVRLQSAYWESALNWLRLQTHFGGDSEMLQAEVEHVLSPMAAGPLMWPLQEATRQMAQMAASGWNDWLNWGGHFADAGRTLFSGATQARH